MPKGRGQNGVGTVDKEIHSLSIVPQRLYQVTRLLPVHNLFTSSATMYYILHSSTQFIHHSYSNTSTTSTIYYMPVQLPGRGAPADISFQGYNSGNS